MPHLHFMALAPLDAWAKLLLRAGAWRRISWRYWPRVLLGLSTSCVGTLITLPERIVLGLIDRLRARRGGKAGPVIVFVLGYYRSGTTHLHYLLSCDPLFVTPKWHQVVAPGGGWVSWQILRWLLVPFLSSTRPQDDVAIGPEWPAEDDFAHNNAACACTMPGRMILPGLWDHYQRYQRPEDLTERERAEFERVVRAFSDRVARRAGVGAMRPLLLKTPAHTARVAALVRLFGVERVRFIHLSREPGAVLKSNTSMHRRFEPYLLMDHPGDDEIRRRIIVEYDRTERAFLEQSRDLPPGTVCRMRYEDLVVDPMGELRRCYGELGLPWTTRFERQASAYLDSVRDYRTASDKAGAAGPSASAGKPGGLPVPEELAWLIAEFGHDRPAPRVPGPISNSTAREPDGQAAVPTGVKPTSQFVTGAAALCVAAALCACLWLSAAWLAWDRMDWLVWPVGAVLGLTALHAAQPGRSGLEPIELSASRRAWLGVCAALATILVVLLTALPATAMTTDYRTRAPLDWPHLWLSTRRGLLATNNFFWVFLGVASAYRFASRKHMGPPGAS